MGPSVDIPLRPEDLRTEVAAWAAARMRELAGADDGAIDIERCCALVGAELREGALGAERRGLQGMLVPTTGDRFRIVVDPTPRGGWDANVSDNAHEALRRRRFRFRVAHEIAHTFCYARSAARRPVRAFRGGCQAEELFCDEFARRLLVPRPRDHQISAHTVAQAHERFDVSLEVAARAAASWQAGTAVALWRWDRPPAGRREILHEQWTSGGRVGALCAVEEYMTDPADLPERFEATRHKLGPVFSAVVLETRSQALAILCAA